MDCLWCKNNKNKDVSSFPKKNALGVFRHFWKLEACRGERNSVIFAA